MVDAELQTLNRRVRDIWNHNADFWDERMGEGNSFQLMLIGPAQERMLDLQPGAEVLEIACGNGNFARRMAELGARVVACDLSEQMIENARARTKERADQIEFMVLDATDETALLALGEGRFDAAVCTMAMMDMPAIEPMLSALSRLLKPDGRFVFSVCHPCFNSTNGLTRSVEREERDGTVVDRHWVKISEYIRPSTHKGLAMIDQPEAQYYFHRPISLLLSACFAFRFVCDRIEEPAFDMESLKPNTRYGVVAARTFFWENFREIPPVLVTRMRLAQ